MQFLTDIVLQRPLPLMDVFRIVENCAENVGLHRCKVFNSDIQVFRPDAENENNLISISRIEDALPLKAGEDVLLTYQSVGGEELTTLYITLRGSGINTVSQVDLESSVHVDGNSTSPDFEIQKQQYNFAKLLHDKLRASVTIGYPDENEECPFYRFSNHLEPIRLSSLE